MVPTTWLSVLFFFRFVALGTLFLLLSKRRRKTIADSAFVEISRVVLASLVFTGLEMRQREAPDTDQVTGAFAYNHLEPEVPLG